MLTNWKQWSKLVSINAELTAVDEHRLMGTEIAGAEQHAMSCRQHSTALSKLHFAFPLVRLQIIPPVSAICSTFPAQHHHHRSCERGLDTVVVGNYAFLVSVAISNSAFSFLSATVKSSFSLYTLKHALPAAIDRPLRSMQLTSTRTSFCALCCNLPMNNSSSQGAGWK